MEIDEIKKYQVFKDYGIAKYNTKSKQITNEPHGHQEIMVHVVFASKHDGHHKAHLVACVT